MADTNQAAGAAATGAEGAGVGLVARQATVSVSVRSTDQRGMFSSLLDARGPILALLQPVVAV
jgi:hypothetical protein